jgi:hypothetical protein
MVKGIGWFVPIMKERADMNYQYDRDYYFDSSKFNNYFKFIPTSPEAVYEEIEQRLILNALLIHTISILEHFFTHIK